MSLVFHETTRKPASSSAAFFFFPDEHELNVQTTAESDRLPNPHPDALAGGRSAPKAKAASFPYNDRGSKRLSMGPESVASDSPRHARRSNAPTNSGLLIYGR
jgi:hypothetical protein